MITTYWLRVLMGLGLYGSAFASAPLIETLQQNTWHMTRQTGIGKVETSLTFLSDSAGESNQKVTKSGQTTEYHYTFTYTVQSNRVILQEEIDPEWEGHFGVTRWTLIDGNLIHDVNFRNEVITLIPQPR